MIIMKKSFLKSAVSVVAAAVMAITSVSAVFAANDYTSETYSSSKWSKTEYTANGIKMTVTDGMLKSERSIFRANSQDYTADGNAWGSSTIEPGNTEAVYNLSKKLSSGKAQAKFDVKFAGGDGQKINFMFEGYAGQTGLQIRKSSIALICPTGAYSKNVSHTKLSDNTWYTYTAILDMTKKSISFNVVKKDDGTQIVSNELEIPQNQWGDNLLKSVTSLNFRSGRDQDVTEAKTVTVVHPTSVWYINNVEYDAYTETNYAIKRVERTSKKSTFNSTGSEAYADKGFALKRLTKVADPKNASFITAGYDSDNRMVNATSTPLANITNDYINVGVTGNKVKAFVMDSNDATPYATAYDSKTSTKVRTNGFENDFNDIAANNTVGISTSIVKEGENSVLKSERTIFRNGGKNYKWDGTKWAETSEDPKMLNAYIKLDKHVSDMTISYKVKFAGNNNGKGKQAVSLVLNGSSLPIDLIRLYDGTVSVKHRFNGKDTKVNFKANEWYDVTLKISNLGSSTSFDWTFAKDGAVVGTCSASNIVWGANTNNEKIVNETEAVGLYSRRDEDLIVTSATDVAADKTQTTSSVWYVDDFSVEY